MNLCGPGHLGNVVLYKVFGAGFSTDGMMLSLSPSAATFGDPSLKDSLNLLQGCWQGHNGKPICC